MSLEDTWLELLRAAKQSAGRPVGMWAGGLVLATVSGRGTPQLVVQISGPDTPPPSTLETVGFQVDYQPLVVGQGTTLCAVLEPKEPDDLEMFNAVCEHLLSELAKLEGDQSAHAVDSVIRDWLDFWRTLKQAFPQSSFIGLIGELLTFDRWLDKDTFRWEFWQGPSGGPHDFCGGSFDVEVKTSTKRTGPLLHEISSIEQLQERANRQLVLMSFRLGFSATGAQSTHELVQRISSHHAFQGVEAGGYLAKALSEGGYSSSLPSKFERFDVWSEKMYQIQEGFPRLTRETVPFDERITDLRYTIDLSGCEAYLKLNSELDLGS
jgi:hypothetical protein